MAEQSKPAAITIPWSDDGDRQPVCLLSRRGRHGLRVALAMMRQAESEGEKEAERG